jgi:hypothetical protein
MAIYHRLLVNRHGFLLITFLEEIHLFIEGVKRLSIFHLQGFLRRVVLRLFLLFEVLQILGL